MQKYYAMFQGAQIDSVEYFAEKAINNIDSGRTDLASAKRKQKKYRRVRNYILIILIPNLIDEIQ